MANRKETGDEGVADHVNFGELVRKRIQIPLHKPHRAASTAQSDWARKKQRVTRSLEGG